MKKKRPSTGHKQGPLYDEFFDSLEGVWVWTLIIGGALILGFTSGYWLGHEQIMSSEQSVKAFAGLPLMLGRWQVFIMFGITVLAWYVPMYREEWQVRFSAPLITAIGWLIAINSLVKSERFY